MPYIHVPKDVVLRQKRINELSKIIDAAQPIHGDQVYYLVSQLIKLIQEEGSIEKVEQEYDPPRGFDNAWNAAINYLKKTNISEARITFAHAKEILLDIEQSKGRILEIIKLNPWLVEESKKDAVAKYGNSFNVYRALTLTGPLNKENIVSTTPKIFVASSILIKSPVIIFHKNDMIKTEKIILKYKITSNNIIAYVPTLLKYVKETVGKKTNRKIEDRYGTKISIEKILELTNKLDEEEIIADVSNLTPVVLNAEDISLYALSHFSRYRSSPHRETKYDSIFKKFLK